MCELSVTQHWADGNVTQLSVTTEDEAIPVALFGIIALWQATCVGSTEDVGD